MYYFPRIFPMYSNGAYRSFRSSHGSVRNIGYSREYKNKELHDRIEKGLQEGSIFLVEQRIETCWWTGDSFLPTIDYVYDEYKLDTIKNNPRECLKAINKLWDIDQDDCESDGSFSQPVFVTSSDFKIWEHFYSDPDVKALYAEQKKKEEREAEESRWMEW